MAAVSIVRGTNDKPAASQALIDTMTALPNIEGQLMIGYPIVSAADGRHPIDAVLVSPQHGVVVFDLIEGSCTARSADRARVVTSVSALRVLNRPGTRRAVAPSTGWRQTHCRAALLGTL